MEFLLAKKRNEKLNEVYKKLEYKTIEAFKNININLENYNVSVKKFELLSFFINSMILSSNILNARETLFNNESAIEKIFLLILKEG